MVGFQIGWSGVGVIREVRELKTKAGKVWAHGVKLDVMGGTYELTTQNEALAKQCGAGAVVKVSGGFELYQNFLKLRLESVESCDPAKPAEAPVARRPVAAGGA